MLLLEEIKVKLSKIGKSKNTGEDLYFAYINPKDAENSNLEFKDIGKVVRRFGGNYDKTRKVYFWWVTEKNKNVVFNKNIKPALEELNKMQNSSEEETKSNIDIINKMVENLSDVQKEIEKISEPSNNIKKTIFDRIENFKERLSKINTEKELKELLREMRIVKSLKGYNYSGWNSLIIRLQDPHAAWVGGREDWKRFFNRNIKKNAPMLVVSAPKTHRNTNVTKEKVEKFKAELINKMLKQYEVSNYEDLPAGVKLKIDKTIKKHKQEFSGHFEYVPVYDVRFTVQIEGKEDLVQKALDAENKFNKKMYGTGEKDEKVRVINNALLDLAKKYNIKINWSDTLGGAQGMSQSGQINILKHEGNDVGLVKALVHETAHEIMHQQYLVNKYPTEFKKFNKGKSSGQEIIEQEAEFVAWMVMDAFGFQVSDEGSKKYIIGWGAKNKDDLLSVFRSIADVGNFLINNIIEYAEKNNIKLMEENINNKKEYITPEDVAKKLGLENVYKELETKENQNMIENIVREEIIDEIF